MKRIVWILIILASKFTIASAAQADVVGSVTAPSSFSNKYAISGWACERGQSQSIKVHIYLGGPARSGQIFKSVTANRSSEKAVSDACRSSGTAYRFKVPMSHSQAMQHKGKKIYAHGISRSGSPNPLLSNSGVYRVPSPPEPKVIGHIDSITKSSGQYFVRGWSCQIGETQPIRVHLYAGGKAGAGDNLRSEKADFSSEQAIADKCYTNARNYRFRIPIESDDIINYANQRAYVHGISLNGTPNNLINRSGSYRLPKEANLSDLIRAKGTGDIVIPSDLSIKIDQSVNIGLLKVNGSLICGASGDYQIKTAGILVEGSGAKLQCGSESSPYKGKLDFVLKDNRELGNISSSSRQFGGKAIVAHNGGTIRLHGKPGKEGFVRLAQHAQPNDSSLYLSRSVSWEVGDSIVVASSNFNPSEAETFTVTDVSPTGRRIHLDRQFQHLHWGKTQSYSNGKGNSWVLDQRAEVANLSRNIRVSAPVDSYTQREHPIGAHMTVAGSNSQAFIDNVEFNRVGQMGKMGRYPFHWHLMGNVSGQYIVNSSIHESYQRCITIHGTHHALVRRNTCYDHFGHGYFMENGNEIANRIEGNIGILSKMMPKEASLLDSEFKSKSQNSFRYASPSTFWITHPSNYVVNNVAAGSEGTGFWMSFKKAMYCTSSGCIHRSSGGNVSPASSKTFRFDNNTAHSSLIGITHDGAHDGAKINGSDLNRELKSAHYDPAELPVFKNLVAYKNVNTGLYYRGSRAVYDNAILADNGASGFFAYDQELIDSLVVGLSNNHSQDDSNYYAANTNWSGAMSGVRIYDGPFYLDGVHFADFPVSREYGGQRDITPTAIMLMGGAARYVNQTKNITFNPSSIARKIDMTEDGNFSKNWGDSYSAGLLDKDGSLLGDPNTLIRPLNAMNNEPGCHQSNEYGEVSVLKCNQHISHFRFSEAGQTKIPFKVQRISPHGDVASHDTGTVNGKHYNKFSMIMGKGYEYHVRNLDRNRLNGLIIDYSANTPSDLSPIVTLIEVGDCAISGARRVSRKSDLENANFSAYWSAYGNLAMKLKGDRISKMRQELPHARKRYSLSCN